MNPTNLWDQILRNRNPYHEIGIQAQERVARRAPQTPQEAQGEEQPAQTEERQEPSYLSQSLGSQNGLNSDRNDTFSSIQAHIADNQRLRRENQSRKIQDQIQGLLRNNNRDTNDLTQPRESNNFAPVTGENGRLDTSQLVDVDGNGNFLAPAAANAWQQMVAAAAADGINLAIGNSYRPYETQVRLAEEKGLYSEGGLAAEPGTSNHGWGTAVDIVRSPQAEEWLRNNAAQYGFSTIPREPWHWEYKP